MNVITVKLRRPTIPKVPRAAKIILGSPKHCRRYGVSYCCSVTQACGRNRRGERSYSSELCLLSAHVRLWVMKKAPPAPTWHPPISNSGHFSSHSKSLGFISMAMVPLGPGAFREMGGSANSIPLHSALIAATLWKELKGKRGIYSKGGREVIIAFQIMHLVLSQPWSHLSFSLLDCVTIGDFQPISVKL